MLNLAIRNIGLIAVALAICLSCDVIEGHTAAIRQNTAQVANAVTCHAEAQTKMQLFASGLNADFEKAATRWDKIDAAKKHAGRKL